MARRGADAYAADGACREQRAFEVELVNEVVRAEQALELDLRRLSAAAREEACARCDGAWARLARDARRGVERVRCEYSFGQFFRAMLEGGIYLAPSQFEAAFVSAAHSEEDIRKTIAAAQAA